MEDERDPAAVRRPRRCAHPRSPRIARVVTDERPNAGSVGLHYCNALRAAEHDLRTGWRPCSFSPVRQSPLVRAIGVDAMEARPPSLVRAAEVRRRSAPVRSRSGEQEHSAIRRPGRKVPLYESRVVRQVPARDMDVGQSVVVAYERKLAGQRRKGRLGAAGQEVHAILEEGARRQGCRTHCAIVFDDQRVAAPNRCCLPWLSVAAGVELEADNVASRRMSAGVRERATSPVEPELHVVELEAERPVVAEHDLRGAAEAPRRHAVVEAPRRLPSGRFRREGRGERLLEPITIEVAHPAGDLERIRESRHEWRVGRKFHRPRCGGNYGYATAHDRVAGQESHTPGKRRWIDRLVEDDARPDTQRDISPSSWRDHAHDTRRATRGDDDVQDPEPAARGGELQGELLARLGGDRERIEAAVHQRDHRRRRPAGDVADPHGAHVRERARWKRHVDHRHGAPRHCGARCMLDGHARRLRIRHDQLGELRVGELRFRGGQARGRTRRRVRACGQTG